MGKVRYVCLAAERRSLLGNLALDRSEIDEEGKRRRLFLKFPIPLLVQTNKLLSYHTIIT
jgi:hypothetical protein